MLQTFDITNPEKESRNVPCRLRSVKRILNTFILPRSKLLHRDNPHLAACF